jgi:outer membrane lipopolysaccharide assembly protein LptE/RlpB
MMTARSTIGIKNLTVRTISVLTLLICGGCGYTLQGSGSILPPDVKVVAIPIVENNTTEPSLTALMTEALRDRFERFGVVSVVDEIRDADAVLQARILGVSRKSRSVTSRTSTALQYDTTITVSAVLKKVSGQVLWRSPSMSVARSYGATSDVVITTSADFSGSTLDSDDLAGLDTREISRGQEQEALSLLSEEVARKIYDESVAPDF